MERKPNYRLTTAVEIYGAACGMLRRVQALPDPVIERDADGLPSDHIGVEPMLLAFSMELALKAWFVFDYNVPEAERGHDLLKLFDALTPESKKKLQDGYQSKVAPRHPRTRFESPSIRDLLDHHRDAFVVWRYLHERNRTLRFDIATFETTLTMALAEFRKRYRVENVPPHL